MILAIDVRFMTALAFGSLFAATPTLAQLTSNRESTVRTSDATTHVESPLQFEEQKLISAPTPVKYYLMKEFYPELRATYRDYLNAPEEKRKNLLSNAYYMRALMIAGKMAMDSSCIVILNRLTGEGNAKNIALEWEAQYLRVVGSFPDVVPVDTDSVSGSDLAL